MSKSHAITTRSFVRILPLRASKICRLAQLVLNSEKVRQAEISIAVVGDKRMADFAERYAHRRYRTDVFAFNLSDKTDRQLLGQIIVNSQLAHDQAKKLKTDPAAELALYIVHGLLHLIGYDDHARNDAEKMHTRCQRYLVKAGFKQIPPMPRFKEGLK